MYTYLTVYSDYYEKLISVTLDNNNLKIKFKLVGGKSGYKNATIPQRTFLVIKMDKLNIDMVEFREIY